MTKHHPKNSERAAHQPLRGVSSITILLLLAAPVLCGQSVDQCPPRPDEFRYGITVLAMANANVGGGHLDKKMVHNCWMSSLNEDGNAHESSDGKGGHLSSDYTYTVTPNSLTFTARLSADADPKQANGHGLSRVDIRWMDLLLIQSKKLATKPDVMGSGNVKLNQEIHLEIRFRPGSPQCSGNNQYFRFSTTAVASVAGPWSSIYGTKSAFFGPMDIQNGTKGDNQFLRKDWCLGGPVPSQTVDALDGWHLGLIVDAMAILNGILSGASPKADMQVNLNGMGVCIVRPKEPDDLIVTSASGTNYWCADGSPTPRR